VITVSARATTLFLGGWRAPWPISVWSGADSGWWPVLWFLGKVLAFIFVFFWLRSALPRVRYDQLMKLGWKVLIPSALAWTLIVATARVYRRQGGSPAVYIVAGLIVLVLLALVWRWESASMRQERLAAEAEEDRDETGDESPPPPAFPTPPMDLPHYHGIGLDHPGTPVLAGVAGDDSAAGGTKEVTGA
jgi:NADH-quinone oxidoreductase subunit H